METIAILGVAVFLAFLVESTVEYLLGTPMDKVQKLTPYKWLLMYAAMGVGLLGAFVYKLDLIAQLGQSLGTPIQSTTLGIVLTGIAIGRGGNFISDLWGRFFKKPEAP